MAGHWATTACPVINDEISYKMIERPEYPLCRQLSESVEKLLSRAGFHIYEHQTAADLHRDYIRNFELLNNRSFPLSDDLRYCLAVKKIRVCDSIALNKRC